MKVETGFSRAVLTILYLSKRRARSVMSSKKSAQTRKILNRPTSHPLGIPVSLLTSSLPDLFSEWVDE